MKKLNLVIYLIFLLFSFLTQAQSNVLWEDFEDGNDAGLLRGNWWGGGWSGGTGVAIYNSTESGKDGNYCAQFTFTNAGGNPDPTTVLSAAWYPGDPTAANAGTTNFWAGISKTGANLNTGTAIVFKFKCDNSAGLVTNFKIQLISRNDIDYDWWEAKFTNNGNWTTYTLYLNTNVFHRAYNGSSSNISFETSCSLVRKVEFKSVTGNGSQGKFWVDSCYIIGTNYVPGLSIDHLTLSNTILIEDWNDFSTNGLGGNNEIFTYNSGDSYTTNMIQGPGGTGDTALKISYTHANSGSPPKVALKLDFLSGGAYYNINPLRYIKFHIKGSGHPIQVVLVIKNEDELAYNNFVYRIVHPPSDWQEYKVPFGAFERENYGTNSDWGTYGSPNNGGGRPYNMPRIHALSNIKSILFTTKSESYGESGWFAVDNISFVEDENPPLSNDPHHCLVGAYCDGWSGSDMDNFKNIAKKNGGAIGFFDLTSSSNEILTFINECRIRGLIPMITLEPTASDPYDDTSYLVDIANGNYDANLTHIANAVKEGEVYTFIRFGHEMNGDWYSWSRYNADGSEQNSSGEFQNAWIHTYNLFKTTCGATNAKFVWAPNNFSYPYNKTNNGLIDFWPGSAYVDWIGISGYVPKDRDCMEYTVDWAIGAVWPEIVNINSNNKPIMIAEFSAPADGTTVKNDPNDVNSPQPQPLYHRAMWTTNFYNSLRRYYTNIRAVFWFHANKGGEPDYRVNGGNTPQAQFSASNAYLTAIQYNISNAYFTSHLPGINISGGVGNVTSFSLYLNNNTNVVLKWQNPSVNYDHTVIVRKQGMDMPISSTNDGVIIYSGTNTIFTDTSHSSEVYTYKAFVVGTNGNVSTGVKNDILVKDSLMDNFIDGNSNATNNWGKWTNGNWGANSDGTSSLNFTATGITDNSLLFNFQTDSGGWGGANFYLQFPSQQNLLKKGCGKICFYAKGNRDEGNFYIQIETPLGPANGYQYYRYYLNDISSNEWKYYEISFTNFTGSATPMNYSLNSALSNCTGFKWEIGDPNKTGSIYIDIVRIRRGIFNTTESTETAITGTLVDNFADGDNIALNNWGSFTHQEGGENNDGTGNLLFNATGITDFALKYYYKSDTGSWAYNNVFLDFGTIRDLVSLNLTNISFWIKGSNNAKIKFLIETPYANFSNNWAHYEYDLGTLSTNWQYITINFKDMQWNGGTSGVYSLETALKNASGLKWENSTPGGIVGVFYLDNIQFGGSLSPQDVSDFNLTVVLSGIRLKWKNPSDFDRVIIVRKEGINTTISSTNDGIKIYSGTGELYTDSYNLKGGIYYTYKIFVVKDGNLSSGVSKSIKYILFSNEAIVINNFYNAKTSPSSYPQILINPETSGKAVVKVYNINGTLIKKLFTGNVEPGNMKRIIWDLTDESNNQVAGGIYLVRIELGSKVIYRKIIIVR